jgi:hypothetical protein
MHEFPKPDEKHFDLICTAICKVLWKDPNAALYGRSGQKQGGLDSLGEFRAAQHKAYRRKKFTKETITKDIAKADKSTTDIQQLLFLTTADADAEIQKFVRTLNTERKKTGKFGVIVNFWDEICALLRQKKYSEIAEEHFPTHPQSTQRKTLKKVEEIESILKKSRRDSFIKDPHKYNLNIAKWLGYDAAQDVRPNAIAMGAQSPLLVVFGQSGSGKSWALCAHALSWNLEQTKLLVNNYEVAQVIDQIGRCQPFENQLVVLVDGLTTVGDVQQVWQACSQKNAQLILSASNELAGELKSKRIGGDGLQQIEVQEFSLAELIELLRRNSVEISSIPRDMIETLRAPLLARLYLRLPTKREFTGPLEYQLFENFWQQAFELSPLCASALRKLSSSGEAPNKQIAAKLMQIGWLRADNEFAHDRLKQWALAEHLTHSAPDEEIFRRLFDEHRAHPYLLLDWMWLNLPAKSKLAATILSFPDWNHESHKQLITLGGRAILLLILLASTTIDECIDENFDVYRLQLIASALRSEAIDQRNKFFGAQLRAWLRSSNTGDAATVLQSVCVPETFSALWDAKAKLAIGKHSHSRYLIRNAIKHQLESRPDLLATSALEPAAHLGLHCEHVFDLPIGHKRLVWEVIRTKLASADQSQIGPSVISCIRKFCDIGFVDQLAALVSDPAKCSSEWAFQEALVALSLLSPATGIPKLLQHKELATLYRQQWVPRASMRSMQVFANALVPWFDSAASAATCILENTSCSIPPVLFERYLMHFAANAVQWSDSKSPRFGSEVLMFATEDLGGWSRLQGTEAENNLVRLILSRPFCGHTAKFCLRALAAIDGLGIATALSDETLLENCSAANQMLATYGTCAIPQVREPRDFDGYCAGIIAVEGLRSFIGRYLQMDKSNLPKSIFKLYQSNAASPEAYMWTKRILADASNCSHEDLYRAWCVLALAPNSDLNDALLDTIQGHTAEHLWPLFEALKVAEIDHSTLSEAILPFVCQGNTDAMNFLLGLNDASVDEQLSDLVELHTFQNRERLAAILLPRIPHKQHLQQLIFAQRPNPMQVPLSMSTFAKHGNETQKEMVLEFARAPSDFVSTAQPHALMALRHFNPRLSVELALSALRRPNTKIGDLCWLIASLDKNDAPKRLLECLSVNWSVELGRSIGVELRSLDSALVLEAVKEFSESTSAHVRRAAVLVCAWIPEANSILEALIDDTEPDVMDAAQIAFQISQRLRLAQHFANQLRTEPSSRRRSLQGYLDFADPTLALTKCDSLSIDWAACGFSAPQELIIKKRLSELTKQSIDYEKISSFFIQKA